MQDRLYQKIHIHKVIHALETHNSVCGQLPTGGGKTYEFSCIIRELFYQRINIDNGPVLILVHRIELLHQAAKAVKDVLGFEPCLITSDTDRFNIARVYIGMIDSTMSRLHMINNPSLIIIDEAHQQNFIKVHKQFPNTKKLGWTATPKSVSPKTPMKDFYETIVTGPQISELISLGFLSQNRTRTPKSLIDLKKLSYDKLTGDYNIVQLGAVYKAAENIENVIHKYWEFCLKKKTLVFNVNIETSKEVARYFTACGIKCWHLDSNSEKYPAINPKRFKSRRDEILWEFKTTEDGVLCSVMIPTMGYDEPTIERIILNYSTASLVKFIQTCGRGSRIIDDYFIEKFQCDYPYPLKLKYDFEIIDLGGNYNNFGDWSDPRDWDYIFWYPDLPGEGIAPKKICPQDMGGCGSLVHASVRMCPFCEFIFPKKQGEQIDMEEMIMVTKGVDVDSLNDRTKNKYKYYPFYELAIDVVLTMLDTYGKTPSQNVVDRFFRVYYNKCVEWYDKTLAKNPEEIGDISNSSWHIKKAKHNFNSLINYNSKESLKVRDNEKDVIHPDYPENVKQRELVWQQSKSEVL